MKPLFCGKPRDSNNQGLSMSTTPEILNVSLFREELQRCKSYNEQTKQTFSNENTGFSDPIEAEELINQHVICNEEAELLINDSSEMSTKEELDKDCGNPAGMMKISSSAYVNMPASDDVSKESQCLSSKEKEDPSPSFEMDMSSINFPNFSCDKDIDRSTERRSISYLPSVLQFPFVKKHSLPTALPVKKESLPSLHNFLMKNSSNLSLSSEKFNSLDHEWRNVFKKLSKRTEGEEQRKIKRAPMLQWAATLDEGTMLSFEIAAEPVTRQKLMRIISEADADKDGYLNEEEFYSLIKEKNAAATPNQQSRLQSYMLVLAHAEKYKLWPPPWFILLISLLQIYFYLSYTSLNYSHTPITCSKLIFNPWQRWQMWRFVTYGLLHDGAIHLVTNLGVQLLVGLPLEMSHSSGRILVIYLSGVLAGSLGTSLLDPQMFLAGGSGGAYALIAAHLATLILNWKEDQVILGEQLNLNEGRITSAAHGRLVSILRLAAVLVFALVDTGVAVYHRVTEVSTTTGYHAHVAGALAGLTMGIVVLKNRKVEAWQLGLRFACLLFFLVCVVAGVLWNLFSEDFGRGDQFEEAGSIKQKECVFYDYFESDN